jgi:hypothetical protein
MLPSAFLTSYTISPVSHPKFRQYRASTNAENEKRREKKWQPYSNHLGKPQVEKIEQVDVQQLLLPLIPSTQIAL